MIFRIIKSEGIAHNSYFLGDKGKAVVIDPRRDVEVYLDLAQENDLQVSYIFETHRNEDYVVGSRELQKASGGEIYHGEHFDFDYGNPVKEKDKFRLGNMELEILETPGHTKESISLVLRDLSVTSDVQMVFTGDLIFTQIIHSSYNFITFSFANRDTTNKIYDALLDAGFQPAKLSEEPSNTQINISIGIADWIKENLRAKISVNSFTILKEDRVGPKIGDELKRDAVLAIFFSLIAILIYIGFRFKFIFALGSVAALFYNVLVTLGLFAVLYGVVPGLNLEIDLNIVAAFLTLIGYSINDTIVVFDRIRENLKIHKTRSLYDIINTSLSQTMSRTVLTGGSVILTLIVLLIFGGEVLRAFAFTLLAGILIGTYSSVFVASMLVYEYVVKIKKKVEF